MAQGDQKAVDEKVLERAVKVYETHDSFKAFAVVEEAAEAVDAANRYSQLVRKLYFEKKNVPAMIFFGRAGIHFCFEKAKDPSDDKQRAELLGLAKTMAFNAGANCWPGWNDEGVTITSSDLAAGLDCARLNLRLAGELKRDDKVFGNAHWLVGAHLLAAGSYDDSVEQFKLATKKNRAGQQADAALMAAGYEKLALTLKSPDSAEARQAFESAVTELDGRQSKDAKFYAEQLRTAHKVFSER